MLIVLKFRCGTKAVRFQWDDMDRATHQRCVMRIADSRTNHIPTDLAVGSICFYTDSNDVHYGHKCTTIRPYDPDDGGYLVCIDDNAYDTSTACESTYCTPDSLSENGVAIERFIECKYLSQTPPRTMTSQERLSRLSRLQIPTIREPKKSMDRCETDFASKSVGVLEEEITEALKAEVWGNYLVAMIVKFMCPTICFLVFVITDSLVAISFLHSDRLCVLSPIRAWIVMTMSAESVFCIASGLFAASFYKHCLRRPGIVGMLCGVWLIMLCAALGIWNYVKLEEHCRQSLIGRNIASWSSIRLILCFCCVCLLIASR